MMTIALRSLKHHREFGQNVGPVGTHQAVIHEWLEGLNKVQYLVGVELAGIIGSIQYT